MTKQFPAVQAWQPLLLHLQLSKAAPLRLLRRRQQLLPLNACHARRCTRAQRQLRERRCGVVNAVRRTTALVELVASAVRHLRRLCRRVRPLSPTMHAAHDVRSFRRVRQQRRGCERNPQVKGLDGVAADGASSARHAGRCANSVHRLHAQRPARRVAHVRCAAKREAQELL